MVTVELRFFLIGVRVLVSILQSWYIFFIFIEVISIVVVIVVFYIIILRFSFDYLQREELVSCVRILVLQCVMKDLQSCVLLVFIFCEKDYIVFEVVYQIVIDVVVGGMIYLQLFIIVRYMEFRGYSLRVFKLVLLVMSYFNLVYNQDIYLVINDVFWACVFSYFLGKNELVVFIFLVVKSVYCVIVFSDILRRCIVIVFGLVGILGRRSFGKFMFIDKVLLRQLLDVIINVYINIIYLRLIYISFRYYGEFIEFLSKVREIFLLFQDGYLQFV